MLNAHDVRVIECSCIDAHANNLLTLIKEEKYLKMFQLCIFTIMKKLYIKKLQLLSNNFSKTKFK